MKNDYKTNVENLHNYLFLFETPQSDFVKNHQLYLNLHFVPRSLARRGWKKIATMSSIVRGGGEFSAILAPLQLLHN